jgi:hypothetical protein
LLLVVKITSMVNAILVYSFKIIGLKIEKNGRLFLGGE